MYLYDTNIDKIEKKIQDSESHNINVDVYHAFSRKLEKFCALLFVAFCHCCVLSYSVIEHIIIFSLCQM